MHLQLQECAPPDEHSVALLAAAAADAVRGCLPLVPVAQPEEIPALATRGHSAVDVKPVNSLLVAFAYGHHSRCFATIACVCIPANVNVHKLISLMLEYGNGIQTQPATR